MLEQEPEFVTFEHAEVLVDNIQDLFPMEPIIISRPDLLASALARPINALCYDEEHALDLFDLAAITMEAVAKNHPLQQGNKRLALLCGMTFMAINGYLPSKNLELWAKIDNYCFERYDTYAFDLLMRHNLYNSEVLRSWFAMFAVSKGDWRKEYSNLLYEATKRWLHCFKLDIRLRIADGVVNLLDRLCPSLKKAE